MTCLSRCTGAVTEEGKEGQGKAGEGMQKGPREQARTGKKRAGKGKGREGKKLMLHLSDAPKKNTDSKNKENKIRGAVHFSINRFTAN